MIGGAYLLLPVVALAQRTLAPLLPVLSAPLAWRLVAGAGAAEGPLLIGVLVKTARLVAVFGILLALGLWVGRWI